MITSKIVTVQRSLMIASSFNWDIDWRGKSAGDTNGGTSEVVYSNFPRWYGSPRLGLCQDVILQWRAIRAAARGRVNVFRIPMIDEHGYAKKISAKIFDLNKTQGIGGLVFSDYTPTEYQPFMLVKQLASKGSTSLVVDTNPVPEYVPQVGEILSNRDWPFIVTEVLETGSYEYTLTIEPPLRINVPVGEMIDIVPYGLFKMNTDTTGNPSYSVNTRSTPTLDLLEWLR
jgi:hypothetical protein